MSTAELSDSFHLVLMSMALVSMSTHGPRGLLKLQPSVQNLISRKEEEMKEGGTPVL
jgi:hypothetical protein